MLLIGHEDRQDCGEIFGYNRNNSSSIIIIIMIVTIP
jgi:hypothetical protein